MPQLPITELHTSSINHEISDRLVGCEVLVIADREVDLAEIDAALASLGRVVALSTADAVIDRDAALIILSTPDGVETARTIRDCPRHAGTPILVITGATLPTDATAALGETGVFDVVLGPLSPGALRDRVRVHLDLQERTRALAWHLHLLGASALRERDDDVLATLGHELRSPLAAIVCLLDVIKRRDPEPGFELQILEQQIGYLRQLASDLATGSRGDWRHHLDRAVEATTVTAS